MPKSAAIGTTPSNFRTGEFWCRSATFRSGLQAAVVVGVVRQIMRGISQFTPAHELIGNVVRHTNHIGDVEVAVNYGGPDAVLHVMDYGSGFNHINRLPRDPYAEHGRGLFLIAALTDEFTVSERPDGGSHARAVLVRSAA